MESFDGETRAVRGRVEVDPENVGEKIGLEIEVELDNGDLLVVVQEKDDEFAVGDRIRVIRAPNGVVRVRQ